MLQSHIFHSSYGSYSSNSSYSSHRSYSPHSSYSCHSCSRYFGVVIFSCPLIYFSNSHLQSIFFHFPHIVPYVCPFIAFGLSLLAIQHPIHSRFFLFHYLIFQIITFSHFIIISLLSFLMFVPLSHMVYHFQSNSFQFYPLFL